VNPFAVFFIAIILASILYQYYSPRRGINPDEPSAPEAVDDDVAIFNPVGDQSLLATQAAAEGNRRAGQYSPHALHYHSFISTYTLTPNGLLFLLNVLYSPTTLVVLDPTSPSAGGQREAERLRLCRGSAAVSEQRGPRQRSGRGRCHFSTLRLFHPSIIFIDSNEFSYSIR